MKYYWVAIEQAYVTEEGQKVLKEYMTKKEYSDFQSADSAYFGKCQEVANDIDKNHKYMMIQMLNSKFGVVHMNSFGEYQENL